MTATCFPNKTDADYAVPDWIDDHPNARAVPQDNGRAGCPAALVKEPYRRNPRPWLHDANQLRSDLMNPDDLSAPETYHQTWKFETPTGTDLSAVVQAFHSLGCAFNPEEDQLGLGQDTGAYALSSQRQSMKDALEKPLRSGNPPPAGKPSGLVGADPGAAAVHPGLVRRGPAVGRRWPPGRISRSSNYGAETEQPEPADVCPVAGAAGLGLPAAPRIKAAFPPENTHASKKPDPQARRKTLMQKEAHNEIGEVRRVNITAKAINRWQLTNEGWPAVLTAILILSSFALTG